MGEHLVETNDLTKIYGGGVKAVDRVSLTVWRGEVYGFLGPNGAGKTTTLRMLAGLITPTAGSASVHGEQPGSQRALERTGALIESPGFYPYLTGRDNLRVVARYAGVGDRRVAAVLDTVDLTDRAGDRYAGYSLGMKQRLGVAAALLKDPELLILDEPTNGLDPAGMRDMRALIRDLGARGHTVLLSSHLLGEVEQLCDRVGVISGGRLLTESTVLELRGRAGLLVAAEPLDRARQTLERLVGAGNVAVADGRFRLRTEPDQAGRVSRALADDDVTLTELRPLERTLEEVFLEMTGEERTQR
ncbi:MAG TPA: ABC transporter ATP-binding protein [Actinomycetes bacterium]|jgi:ABC-2 type transport system ATP-binding protein|nr:ABC transporter ATP-binding protein [Actinomycetes bacterium]